MKRGGRKRRLDAQEGVSLPAGQKGRIGRFVKHALILAKKARKPIDLKQAQKAFLKGLREQGYAELTLKSYGRMFSALYRRTELEPTTRITAIDREGAKRIVKQLLDGYAPSSRVLYGFFLLDFFKSLEASGLLLRNPFWGSEVPKKNRPLLGPTLSIDETLRLLAARTRRPEDHVKYRALLEVLYSTGIRIAECLGLDIEDVNLPRGLLHIRNGKGGRERVVPLGEKAIRWLGVYISRYRTKYVKDKTSALWISKNGNRHEESCIRKTIRRLALKARIPKPVSAHTLRRTFATHLLTGGASPWVVKEILGHLDPRMLGRYVEISRKELKDAHKKTHPRG